MTVIDLMHQSAPYPAGLRRAVEGCTYRHHEGWRIFLEDLVRDVDADGQPIGRGLTLRVLTKGYDTYHPELGNTYRVNHYFIVPAATYSDSDWVRWLFEQLAKVELHECMENFVVDGARPFPPTHGAGRDPYTVREFVDETDRATRFNDHLKQETP